MYINGYMTIILQEGYDRYLQLITQAVNTTGQQRYCS